MNYFPVTMLSHQSRYKTLAEEIESMRECVKKMQLSKNLEESTKEVIADIEKEIVVYREISISYNEYMKSKSHKGLRRTVNRVLKEVLGQQIADIEISNTVQDPNEKKILPIEEQYSFEESASFSNSYLRSKKNAHHQNSHNNGSRSFLQSSQQGDNSNPHGLRVLTPDHLRIQVDITKDQFLEANFIPAEELKQISVLEYNNLVKQPGRVHKIKQNSENGVKIS